jgi:MFS-type transporter involved in bile tolerance (Atg22 family)
MGLTTALPLFWSLPTAFLAGATAAGGIALINSIANIAGFVSPSMVGWLSTVTGSKDSGMLMLAGFLVLGAGLTLTMPKKIVNK